MGRLATLRTLGPDEPFLPGTAMMAPKGTMFWIVPFCHLTSVFLLRNMVREPCILLNQAFYLKESPELLHMDKNNINDNIEHLLSAYYRPGTDFYKHFICISSFNHHNRPMR